MTWMGASCEPRVAFWLRGLVVAVYCADRGIGSPRVGDVDAVPGQPDPDRQTESSEVARASTFGANGRRRVGRSGSPDVGSLWVEVGGQRNNDERRGVRLGRGVGLGRGVWQCGGGWWGS